MFHLTKHLGVLGFNYSNSTPSTDALRAAFVEHVNTFGHSYGTREEFEFRFDIYKENDARIR